MDNKDKKIKICFISFNAYGLFNPESNILFGGAERQLFLLSNDIAEDKNFDVSFLTTDRIKDGVEKYKNITLFKRLPHYDGSYDVFKNNQKKTTSIDNEYKDHNKIIFRKKLFFKKNNLMLVRSYYWLIRRLIKNILKPIISIVHFIKFFLHYFKIFKEINADIFVHRCSSYEIGLCALECFLLRKKFIFMIANEIDVSLEQVKKMNFYHRKLYLFGLKMADLIITQSKEQSEALLKNFKKQSIFLRSVNKVISNFEKQKRGYILWVSRIDKRKEVNAELFLELAKKFLNENFILIGPKNKDCEELFEEIKSKSKNIKNLKYIDFVPISEIDEFYKKAKIFISTSRYEGFPNTFIQAASYKTPIISLFVNPDNIFEKFKIGFFVNGDFNLMAEKVDLLLKDKKLWEEFSENAYNYVCDNHNLDKISKDYKNLFRDLVSNKI